MDNVGISSQPQTPLPNRSKFFDSHPKKTEVKKNGYRPLQPNATTQKLPSKPLSKPISSALSSILNEHIFLFCPEYYYCFWADVIGSWMNQVNDLKIWNWSP
jgi:hypothetical protein